MHVEEDLWGQAPNAAHKDAASILKVNLESVPRFQVGVGLAACVAAVTLVTILGFLPRMRQLGVDFEANAVGLATTVINGWLALTNFVVLVILAVAYRRQPEIHKRLMREIWGRWYELGDLGDLGTVV